MQPSSPTHFFDSLGGGRFRPTHSTAGPWGPTTQHLGPCSALIARAIEIHSANQGNKRLARITVEALGPVPLEEFSLALRTVRTGRRVELLEAELDVNGQTVLSARAWCLEPAPESLPSLGHRGRPTEARPDPHPLRLDGAYLDGYMTAVEWHFLKGGFDQPGPSRFWARPTVPLLRGEPLTPWQRTLIVADSAYGAALALDPLEHPMINTDLTVSLFRAPQGAWVGVDSETSVEPGGSAANLARLFDGSGTAGHTLQSVVALAG